MKTYKIAFVGTGIIGGGLAVNALLHGHQVVLFVRDSKKAMNNIQKIMGIMVKANAVKQIDADEALKQVAVTHDLAEAVAEADFVQESVSEQLELKKDIYQKIQRAVGQKPIIASSTSALFPSKLQEGALFPDRILVGHPYNPAYLLPLVEVCGGKETSRETILAAMEIYRAIGKKPIECKKEVKGFIVNRISWGAMATAKEIVEEGICSVGDMDRAIMYGPGLRMAVTGQLLTMSLGVDGGFRKYEEKYMGKEAASESYLALADGIDEEIAGRSEEEGRTIEKIIEYRDRMFAEIQKLMSCQETL